MNVIVYIGWMMVLLSPAFKRFFNNPSGSLLNPLFYLIVFSSFYLILPLAILPFTLSILKWELSSEVIFKFNFLSFWYTGILLFFYLKSKDHNVDFINFKHSMTCLTIAKFLNILICAILCFIILFKVPVIYSLRADRGASFSMYQSIIEAPFKLRLIMFLHFGILYYIFSYKRKFIWLLPLLGYLIIDYSHGGRIASLMTLIFFYILLVIDKKQTFFKYALGCVFVFITLGVVQRGGSEGNIIWKLYSASLEFSNTYLTTIYLCDHPEYSLPSSSYIGWSISKIFPGGIIGSIIGTDGWYGEALSNEINFGYGLGGNIITEALVYWGWEFAVINPILIALFAFYANSMSKKNTLAGSLLVIYLCLPMQENFRQFFWGYILYPLQLVFFWGLWVYPDWWKKPLKYVIKGKNNQQNN